MQELNPQLAEYFGVEEGVLVTEVRERSAAADAGLRAGDVITSIDEWAVPDVRNLRQRLSRIDRGQEFEIRIMRDRRQRTVLATIDDRSG